MMINSSFGPNAEHIAGIHNVIPDYVTCSKKTNIICNFEYLKQVLPELTCCHRFRLKKPLFIIFDKVLNDVVGIYAEEFENNGEVIEDKISYGLQVFKCILKGLNLYKKRIYEKFINFCFSYSFINHHNK